MFSLSAAAYDKSITLPFTSSARSVIRTITDLWLRRFTTRTSLPNGSEGWHAVISSMLYVSPLAVLRPSKSDPYHEAMPRNNLPCFCGAELVIPGVGLATAAGEVAAGLGSPASACTVRVESVPSNPAKAKQEVPTRSQNGKGFLESVCVASGRSSIIRFYQPVRPISSNKFNEMQAKRRRKRLRLRYAVQSLWNQRNLGLKQS